MFEKLTHQSFDVNSFSLRMKKAAAALSAAVAAFAAALILAQPLSAEGSNDVYNSALNNYNEVTNNGTSFKSSSRLVYDVRNTVSCGVQCPQKFKFYAYAGETIFFGSSAIPSNGAVAVEVYDPAGNPIKWKDSSGNEHNSFQYEVKAGQTTDKDSTVTGFIPTRDKEKAGPNGVYLAEMDYTTGKPKRDGENIVYVASPVVNGYNPWSFEAETNGVYTVVFHSTKSGNNSPTNQLLYSEENFYSKNQSGFISAWDITVTKKVEDKYYAQPGRVWATAFALQTKDQVYGYFYCVTRDGYIWRLGLNGITPWTTALYTNARGMIGKTTNASLYHSVHMPMSNTLAFTAYGKMLDKNGNPDGALIFGPDNPPTDLDMPYPMFFNYPASDLPSDVVKTTADPIGQIESVRFDGRTGGTLESGGKNNVYGDVGAGGYFEVDSSDGTTSYRVIIDMSNMYAKSYHGQNIENKSDDPEAVHEEEICLSTDDDLNFVYYDIKGKQWYGIYAKTADRHPTTDETMKNPDGTWNFSSIIEYKPIDAPDDLKDVNELNGLGEDHGDYKCLGKIMLGNAAVDGINDRIGWNGRDQYGRILPVGDYFGSTGRGRVYAEAKGGEIHFPIGDAEMIANGLSVWLENPPSGTLTVADRSKIYYNNVDKSLLRDYTTGIYIDDNAIATAKGNNAWYWNLPSNKTCNGQTESGSTGGQVVENADLLDFKWNRYKSGEEYKEYTVLTDWSKTPKSNEVIYENHSIDGVASYEGSIEAKTLTRVAGKFEINCGSDHGVVDFWTHVVGSTQVDMQDPIVLIHVADEVIVSGFVYLEDANGQDYNVNNTKGQGIYNITDEDDVALQGVKIEAVYGTGAKQVTYSGVTNTDGLYSIPVKMSAFTAGEDKVIKITVTYEDPEISGNFATHKVTTVEASKHDTAYNAQFTEDMAGKGVGDSNNYRSWQEQGDAPNVCIITLSLESAKTDGSGNPITVKNFRATDVGYFAAVKTPPTVIQKIWDGTKTSSLKATFTILGFTEEKSLEEAKKYSIDAYGNVHYKNGSDDQTIVGYSASNQDGYVFKRSNVAVSAEQGNETSVDNLLASYDGTNQIYYIVVEEPMGSSEATPEIAFNKEANKWTFTNEVQSSSFEETVFLDGNGNGTYDAGEEMKGVTLTITRYEEGSPEENFTYSTSEEEQKWLKEHNGGMFGGASTGEGEPTYTEIAITRDTQFSLDADAENPFVDGNGKIKFDTLNPGRYSVVITYPCGANYNDVFIDGSKNNTGCTDFTVEKSPGKVTQTFTIQPKINASTMVGVGSYSANINFDELLNAYKTVSGAGTADTDVPLSNKFNFELKKGEETETDTYDKKEEGSNSAFNQSSWSVEAKKYNTSEKIDLGMISFTSVGTYTYTLSESIPTNVPGYMDYDKSEYKIVLKAAVKKGEGEKYTGEGEVTVESITQTKDRSGNLKDDKIYSSASPSPVIPSITFDNELKTGNLTINSTVYGTGAADLTYKITFTAPSGIDLNGTFGDVKIVTAADGTITAEVKKSVTGSDTITIRNLPVGTVVTGIECTGITGGYVLTYIENDKNITIKDETTEHASFYYDVAPVIPLKITKNLDAKLLPEEYTDNLDFTFDIAQTPPVPADNKISFGGPSDWAITFNHDEYSKPVISPKTKELTGKFDESFATEFYSIFADGKAEYSFAISENTGTVKGMTYDPDSHTLAVEISVDKSGSKGKLTVTKKLDETIVGDAAEAKFSNTYEPSEVKLNLTVTNNVELADEHAPIPEGHTYEFKFAIEAGLDAAYVTMPGVLEITGDKITRDSLGVGEDYSAKTQEIPFDSIAFKRAGTYSFTVKESHELELVEGAKWEDTHVFSTDPSGEVTVTVVVNDENGVLSIESVKVGGTEIHTVGDQYKVEFTNTYHTNSCNFNIGIKKTLTGNTLPKGKGYEFNFKIERTSSTHNHHPTLNPSQVSMDGYAVEASGEKILTPDEAFKIKFVEPGDYVFTVTEEITPNAAGFKTPLDSHSVEVIVEDIGGQLEVKSYTVDGTAASAPSASPTLEFNNEYTPTSAQFDLTVNKTVSGNALPNDNTYDFEFTLEEVGGSGSKETKTISGITESNKGAAHELKFSLTFDKAGTYTYNLSEIIKYTKTSSQPNCGFLTPVPITVTVEVTDDGTGELKIDNYTIGSASYEPKENHVTASIDYDNAYAPAPVRDFEIKISKAVTGDEIPAGYGEFGYVLAAETTNPAGAEIVGSSATINRSELLMESSGDKYTYSLGSADLSKITFSAAGTYSFKVTETCNYGGFDPSEQEHTVEVVVIDDAGQLKIESSRVVETSDPGSATSITVPFASTFDAGSTALNFEVNKTLIGNALPDGHSYTFTFNVTDVTGGDEKPVCSQSISASELPKTVNLGSAEFEKAGTYKFRITETIADSKPGGDAYLDTYDNNYGFNTLDEYTLTVVVEEKADKETVSLVITSCTKDSGKDIVFTGTGSPYTVTLDFTNNYDPKDAELTLKVDKKVETAAENILPEGHEYTFNFTLKGDGTDETVTAGPFKNDVAAEQTAEFPTLTFKEAKTYVYTLSETVSETKNDAPVSGDSGFIPQSDKTVTIEVVDDGGQLRVESCTVTETDGSFDSAAGEYTIPITNVYKPTPAKAADVTVVKTLKTEKGSPVDFPEQFSFNAVITETVEGTDKTLGSGIAGWGDDLEPQTTVSTTGGTGGRGTSTLSGLTFVKAGNYKLTLTENEPHVCANGTIEKDSKSVVITYTVTDLGGKLEVTNVENSEGLEFNNIFKPTPKTEVLTFTKKLINTMTGGDRLNLTSTTTDERYQKFKEMYDGKFSFTVSPSESYSPDDIEFSGTGSASNAMNTVNFGSLTFKREGEYTFTLSEVIPDEAGKLARVSYDSKEIKVTYKVTVLSSGELSAVPEYTYGGEPSAEQPAFVNTYGPIPCTLTVTTDLITNPDGIDYDHAKAFQYAVQLSGVNLKPDGGEPNPAAIDTVTLSYYYEHSASMTASLEGDEEIQSVPVTFTETGVDTNIYEAIIPGYIANSFTVEGIAYGNTRFSVKQMLGPDDEALGYKFEKVTEEYTSKSSPESAGVKTDKTDVPPTEMQTETGSFISEFDGTAVIFLNIYTVQPAETELPTVEKIMDGERGLLDGEIYSFDVSLEPGTVGAELNLSAAGVTAVAKDGAASVLPGRIRFTRPGIYTVTVREIEPAEHDDGVTYDSSVYTVVYEATDVNESGVSTGKLSIRSTVYRDGEPTDGIVFTNSYAAADTEEVLIDISSLVCPSDVNALPASEEYRFNVTETDLTDLDRSMTASVSVLPESFDPMLGAVSGKSQISLGAFSDVGDYWFDITEIAGSTPGVKYDSETVHKAHVVVTDNKKGALEYAVYVDDLPVSEAVFTNRYVTGSAAVSNTVTGIGMDPELEFRYRTLIYDGSGNLLEGAFRYTVQGPAGTVSSGTAISGSEIMLKHLQSFTVSGIPDGVAVRIEQTPEAGYVTKVNGENGSVYNGTVVGEDIISAEFLNRIEKFVFKEQSAPGAGETVRTGDRIDYLIKWQNPDDGDAVVVITDILPEGVSLLEAAPGYAYDETTRAVTWRIDAKGLEEGELTLSVTVASEAELLGGVANTAYVDVYPKSGETVPEDPSGHDESEEVYNPAGSVKITKTETLNGEPDTSIDVRAGETVTFELTAEILGAEVKNLTIADVIPEGMVYAGSDDPDAVFDPETNTVRKDCGSVFEAGEKVSLSYRVTVPDVENPAAFGSCGYVYEGVAPAPAELVDGYPWIPSNYVFAYPVADLTVRKTVYAPDGAAPAGVKFRFGIDLSDGNGVPLTGVIYEKNGAVGTTGSGKLSVNLGDGESVTFRDLPAGTVYTITEEPASNFTPDVSNVYSGTLHNQNFESIIQNNYSFVGQKYGDITVTKAVSGTEEDMLRKFGFTMTLADGSVSGRYGDLEFVAGTASFSLGSGEAVTASGLPADVGYVIAEDPLDSAGFKVSDSGNSSGTVPEDGAVTVMFLNERVEGAVGSLTVRNTVIGGAQPFSFTVQLGGAVSGQFGDMIFDQNGFAAFTLAPGQSVTAPGLPAGISYTVTETDAGSYGYSSEYSDDAGGIIPAGSAATVEYINTRKTGGLTVKNTVVGGADPFSFAVTVTGGVVPGSYGGMVFDEIGTARFTLMPGESITAYGLPAEAYYEVVELEANSNGYATASTGASGTVPEGMNALASFVNTRATPGSLTVSKTVAGGASAERFGFGIRITDPSGAPVSGTFGSLTFDEAGNSAFTLSDGENVVIPLPEGTVYEVYEDAAAAAAYRTTVSGSASGTVTPEGVSAAFINEQRTGSLTISNYIGGNAADVTRSFTYTVNAPVTGLYGDMFFDESGTAVFTLAHGRSATASGLPAGISYTVVQTDANTDGYLTTCDGLPYEYPVSGQIAESAVSRVSFRNIRQIDDAETFGTLTVINNVVGTVTDELFDFTVSVSAPEEQLMTLALDVGMTRVGTGPNGEAIFEFSLRHGEAKRITGLPAGAGYSVTMNGNIYYLTSSVNSEGTVPGGGNSTAVFINRWNAGGLTVRAEIEDEAGALRTDDRTEFTYRVTLDGVGGGFRYPSHVTESYSEAAAAGNVMIFDENGIAEFTLRSGETACAPDLPAGIDYRVELISTLDSLHSVISETGTAMKLEAGKTLEAAFVYGIRTGSVVLSKETVNYLNVKYTSAAEKFSFVVNLVDRNGLPLTGSYAYDGASSGTVSTGGTVEVYSGGAITIYGLPEGTEYSFTELEVREYRLAQSENATGTVSAGGTAVAVFVNLNTKTPSLPHDLPVPPAPEEQELPEPPEEIETFVDVEITTERAQICDISEEV